MNSEPIASGTSGSAADRGDRSPAPTADQTLTQLVATCLQAIDDGLVPLVAAEVLPPDQAMKCLSALEDALHRHLGQWYPTRTPRAAIIIERKEGA